MKGSNSGSDLQIQGGLFMIKLIGRCVPSLFNESVKQLLCVQCVQIYCILERKDDTHSYSVFFGVITCLSIFGNGVLCTMKDCRIYRTYLVQLGYSVYIFMHEQKYFPPLVSVCLSVFSKKPNGQSV